MNAALIIGEDDYLVETTARKLIAPEAEVETIDSANSSNAELQLADIRAAEASLLTPSMFSPAKVTWWRNVAFLPGGKSSEEVKSALEKFAQRLAASPLPENQRFILSAPHLLKTSVFAKTLAGVADFVVLAAGKPWEEERNAVVRAIDEAGERGFKFASGAAEKFISIVGIDARSIAREIDKLCDYLGEGEDVATAADVAEIASRGAKVEAEVWDVTDAIGERDLGAAFSALKKFELENGFAVFMSGVIEKYFRQLIAVKSGATEGMNPYAAKKNRAAAANWTLVELRRARARFLALREKVVSGTTAGDVLVVTELARVMRRAARR